MDRKVWVACAAMVCVAVAAVSVAAAGATQPKGDGGKVVVPASGSQAPKVDLVAPGAPDPRPVMPVICYKQICKLDNGVLYRCTAEVTQSCCRYRTSQDCVVDPACSISGLPTFCDPDNEPPNACNNTCH